MSENVFNLIQLGRQSGTFAAPGSAAAASFIFPVDGPVAFDLERGSAIPQQDRGRNSRNSAGTGYHGVRRAGATLPFEAHYEDLMDILEMHCAGSISPSGSGPYVWAYPFEAVSPTIFPYTAEGGNTDIASAEQVLRSVLVSQLTLGFPNVKAGQASPWAGSATLLGIDRTATALTGSLAARTGLETIQGHLTTIAEGTTGTAFASLGVLAGSLRMYTQTSNRSLTLRAYGSTSDLATGFGFSEKSNTTFEALIAVSSTAKTDFHDIWNVASPAALGERRWRLKAIGNSGKILTIDARVAITSVTFDEDEGERLFRVSGEMVDDATLGAPWLATITNSIAALA